MTDLVIDGRQGSSLVIDGRETKAVILSEGAALANAWARNAKSHADAAASITQGERGPKGDTGTIPIVNDIPVGAPSENPFVYVESGENLGIYGFVNGMWTQITPAISIDPITAMRFGSVEFPRENGESPTAPTAMVEITNTPALFEDAGGADNWWFNNDGALLVIWDTPVEATNVARRRHVFLASDRLTDSGTQYISCGFLPISASGGVFDGLRNRAVLNAEGTASQVKVEVASVDYDDGFSGAGLHVFKRDGTDMAVDLFDVADNAKYAGVPVAVPTGWVGARPNVNRNLCVGAYRPDLFPVYATTAPAGQNNINHSYGKGKTRGWCYIDGTVTDAECRAYLAGGDPRTIWDGLEGRATWRVYMPFVENGALDLTLYENGTGHAGGAMPLRSTNGGALLPAQEIGKQGIVASPQKNPCIVALHSHRQYGRMIFSGSNDLGVGRLETRLVEVAADGQTATVVRDWRDSGPMGATWSLDLNIPPMENGQIHGRKKGETDWFVLRDNLHCHDVTAMASQSQGNSGFSQFLLNGDSGDNATGEDAVWQAGDAPENHFYAKYSQTGDEEDRRFGILRGAHNPNWFGGGLIAFFKRMRAYTGAGHTFVNGSQNGTTIRDTLSFGDGQGGADGSAGDLRDIAFVWDAIDLAVSGVGPNGKPNCTNMIFPPHSSDAQDDYYAQVFAPMLTGQPSNYITDIDDYFKSGTRIDADYNVVLGTHNRLANNSTSTLVGPELFTATSVNAVRRDNIRREGGGAGWFIAAPHDVHHLEGYLPSNPSANPGFFTHIEPSLTKGAGIYGRVWAESLAGALGVGTYNGTPAALGAAQFTSAARTAFRIAVSVPIGGALALFDDAGTQCSGFEVNGDRRGFTATIIDTGTDGSGVIEIASTGAAFDASTTWSFKASDGDYGGWNVDEYIDKALVYGDHLFVEGVATAQSVAAA